MGNKVTKITIIRHGETEWNKQGKVQGHLNSPLSKRGIAQVRATASWLKKTDNHYDVLYSSDLGRALQTAEIIAKELDLKINLDKRLRERNLGIMQGLTALEFKRKYSKEFSRFKSADPDYIIPEGESARQRFQRVVVCLNEIVEKNKNCGIIVVTHGGILNSIFRSVFNIELNTKRNFSIINSSINTFTVKNGTWKLESWGNTAHLLGIKALDDF